MRKFLIKNGEILSPANGLYRAKKDILVDNGVIIDIQNSINQDIPVIDAAGCIVTPGLIDVHAHCFPIQDGMKYGSRNGMNPDILGIMRGATTILDAGSSGSANYEYFREHYIDKSKTKVFTLLNVSKNGLCCGHNELDSPEKIDEKALKEIVEKYSSNIVGLKARVSSSVVGSMGLEPAVRAARLAEETKKPLMVHVGNYPPALADVLNLLNRGDIVTHAYHGKKSGILTKNDEIIPEALKARERGVLFDIGHGSESFSFEVYKKAFQKGFACDLISTDLHKKNYEGPVYNLAAVLSKIINCGERLEDAVHKCTCAPARHYGLNGLGEIKEGYIADFTIMQLVSCHETVEDTIGDIINLKEKLVLKKTIYSKGAKSEIFEHDSER